MWLLIFIFLAMTLFICWCLFGYFLLVWFMGLFGRKEDPVIPSPLPTISLIVSCLNEEELILSKLQNIRELDYPRQSLEVFFVDGGSSDASLALLSRETRPEEAYIKIVSFPNAGKIGQMNHVLPKVKGQIIVNTDTDALLSPDALKWIAAEFNRGNDIYVVGAYCRPLNTIDIERYHWVAHNKARFLESDARNSSIVIAPCYAFRRGLLDRFPQDVVADDVYIAFAAHAQKVRVIYSRYATAVETRTPQSYKEFLPHKFRKSNAFLRESLRFLYLLPQMNNFDKMMFVTRLAQQLVLPWALLFWFLLIGALLTLFRYDLVIIVLVVAAGLFLVTSRIFASVRLPGENQKVSLLTGIKGYILTITIMLATGITYPFFKQESIYARIKGGSPDDGAPQPG